ncbi:MAG: hypothetical protein P1Q69_21040, partial [Candidatus Thorarchaeota archaeon]|nr:hypothetical protein [Candidatus Thorarchaeota archaeon]
VILKDNHCRHPRRSGKTGGKVVLVSVCGFAEKDNFDPLVVHTLMQLIQLILQLSISFLPMILDHLTSILLTAHMRILLETQSRVLIGLATPSSD